MRMLPLMTLGLAACASQPEAPVAQSEAPAARHTPIEVPLGELAAIVEATTEARVSFMDPADAETVVTVRMPEGGLSAHGHVLDIVRIAAEEQGLPTHTVGDLLIIDSNEPLPPGATAPEGAIHSLGDNRFAIDASYAQALFDDRHRAARALPHHDVNGDLLGFRISGVGHRSPAAQLGLETGDVVHSVDGVTLSWGRLAIDRAALVPGHEFDVELSRDGERHTFSYQIQ